MEMWIDQIVTEYPLLKWIYKNFTTYVITHRTFTSHASILFTDETPSHLVYRLKNKEGKCIWICGGANIIQPLMQANCIDEFYITVISYQNTDI